MEQWERLLECYEGASEVDVGSFGKLTHTAEKVIKEELAPFEVDWIATTFLSGPVSVLELISSKNSDSTWAKPITDAFKVISTLVEKYPRSVHNHLGDIVKTCQVQLEARARGSALACLAACCALPPPPPGARVETGVRVGAGPGAGVDVQRYVAALETASVCRAPISTLLGVICEYHPEAVADDINRIWRAYLNLLDYGKNTEAVYAAVLRGAARVLRHFGDALPLLELGLLLGPLSRLLDATAPSCRTEALEILRRHARLFREWLASDAALRRRLWVAAAENNAGAEAALAVYSAALPALSPAELQSVLESEVYPRVREGGARLQFCALRVLAAAPAGVAGAEAKVAGVGTLGYVDACALRFRLRSELERGVPLSEYVLEAVSWCIESRVPHCDALLQTALLFPERLRPSAASRLRDAVVRALRLPSSEPYMVANVSFLISESCASGALDRYAALWRALLGGGGGGGDAEEAAEEERVARRFRERFAGRVTAALRQYATGPTDEPERALVSLLWLAARALPPVAGGEGGRGGWRGALAGALRAAFGRAPAPAPGPLAPALALLPLLLDCDDVAELYQACEPALMADAECEQACAAALLHAPQHAHADALLSAVQVVLSRGDAGTDPGAVSLALRRLEELVSERRRLGSHVDSGRIAQVSHVCTDLAMVEAYELRHRIDFRRKEARILHRELLIFLGKHWDSSEYGAGGSGSGGGGEVERVAVRLRGLLPLRVPALETALPDTTVHVERVLAAALRGARPHSHFHAHADTNTDADVLLALAALVCAQPSLLSCEALQSAVVHVCAALARLGVGDGVRVGPGGTGLPLCALPPQFAEQLLEHIGRWECVASRRALVIALSGALSESGGEVGAGAAGVAGGGADLSRLVRTCVDMLQHPSRTRQIGGAEASGALVAALRRDPAAARALLPALLEALLFVPPAPVTPSPAAPAAALYLEMADAFPAVERAALAARLVARCLRAGSSSRTLGAVARFVCDLDGAPHDRRREGARRAFEVLFDVYEKRGGDLANALLMAVELKRAFELSDCVWVRGARSITRTLFDSKTTTDFETRAALELVAEFGEELLDSDGKETVEFVGAVVERIKPASALRLSASIAACIATVTRVLGAVPRDLSLRFDAWTETLELNEITEHMERQSFPAHHGVRVRALHAMLCAFSQGMGGGSGRGEGAGSGLLAGVRRAAEAWPRALLRAHATRTYTAQGGRGGSEGCGWSEVAVGGAETEYWSAALAVALCLSASSVAASLLADADAEAATLFCREFIYVLKPYLLRGQCDLVVRRGLLPDLVTACLASGTGTNNNTGTGASDEDVVVEDLLHLVDQVWDAYAAAASGAQCGAVLAQLWRVAGHTAAQGRAARWLRGAVGDALRPLEERSTLLPALALLPERKGDATSEETAAAWTSYSLALGVRGGGGQGGALLALLNAVCVAPRARPLELLARLVAGDDDGGEVVGWWRAATDSCMASVALRGSAGTGVGVAEEAGADEALLVLYGMMEHNPTSTQVCDLLLVPLLSYSPASVCVPFFARVLPAVVGALRGGQAPPMGGGAGGVAYHRCVVRNTRHVTLLRLMAEKVPRGVLESPASMLHAGVGLGAGAASGEGQGARAWHWVREACRVCVALQQRTVTPSAASTQLEHAVRRFQQAAYGAVCACLVTWGPGGGPGGGPGARIYAPALGAAVWDRLVGDEHYALPLSPALPSVQRTIASGTAKGAGAGAGWTAAWSGGSTRRRVFLTTLSECPNNFDLFEEELESADPALTPASAPAPMGRDTPLSRHPCVAALSALLRHLAALPAPAPVPAALPPPDSGAAHWLEPVCLALRTTRANVRYLLAQSVVRAREELRAHAGLLLAPLLALVAAGGRHDEGQHHEHEGRGLLNSLHLDILETVASWMPLGEEGESGSDGKDGSAGGGGGAGEVPASEVAGALDALVRTCMARRWGRGVEGALLDCVGAMLRVFPSATLNWDLIQPHMGEPASAPLCLRLSLRAVRARGGGTRVPGLVPALIDILEAPPRHLQVVKVAEVVGAALAGGEGWSEMEMETETEREWRRRYSAAAGRARTRSVAEYLAVLRHAPIARAPLDSQHLRTVADLAQKIPSERSKCVSILLANIRAHPDSPAFQHLPDDMRRELDDKCSDRAFEEMLSDEENAISEPSNKRARLTSRPAPRPSPLLRTWGERNREARLARVMARLSDRDRRLDEKLAQDDMPLRFVECFYVCVYLPTKYPEEAWGAGDARLTELARVLVRAVRASGRCQRTPLPLSPYFSSHAAARTSHTRVGTHAGGHSGVRTRTHTLTHTQAHARTQQQVAAGFLPLDDVLDTFIRFGKSCPAVSACLVSQLWQECAARSPAALSDMLASMLADVLDAGPHLLQLARELMPTLNHLRPVKERVEQLMAQHVGSEAHAHLQLLHNELHLRTVLPPSPCYTWERRDDIEDEDDCYKSQDVEFSIDALIGAAGRARDPVGARGALPPLWTRRDHFTRDTLAEWLGRSGSGGWAQCMARACIGGGGEALRDVTREWTRAQRWPIDYFHLSAVREALQWAERGTGAGAGMEAGAEIEMEPLNIREDECLVEWALRLMIRSVYLSESIDDEAGVATSRSHEAEWARCAIERGMPHLALQCVRRNTQERVRMCEREALVWAVLRLAALRAQTRGEGLPPPAAGEEKPLEATLRAAEELGAAVGARGSGGESQLVLELHAHVLQLRQHLRSLSARGVERSVSACAEETRRLGHVTSRDRDNIVALCETAIVFYDDTWDDAEAVRCVERMCDVVVMCDRVAGACYSVAAVLVRRVARLSPLQVADSPTITANLLDRLAAVLARLPACYGAALCPSTPPSHHATAPFALQFKQHEKWARCVELLCGAEVVLLHAVETLLAALHGREAAGWARGWAALERTFGHEMRGAAYRALQHHVRRLQHHREFGEAEEERAAARAALLHVAREVRAGAGAGVRRVAALCPALGVGAGGETAVSEEARAGLAALLQLPEEDVIGIEDEMRVWSDAVSRAGEVRVRVRGARRGCVRFVLKRACAARDAAVRAAAAVLVPHHRLPQVIVLSPECGLIEFLEEHERLRDLIRGECDLSAVDTARVCGRDEDLILAPRDAAETNFAQICARMPPLLLSRAVERRCATVEEYLRRRRRFRRDLVDMTLLTWLLGVGDRHLNNIMYDVGSGGVCALDWDAVFQFGAAELPPARLTRNLLALCDRGVEAEVRWRMRELRARAGVVRATLELAFAHAHPARRDYYRGQLDEVMALVSGAALPCDVTRRALASAPAPNRAPLVQLLDDMFAHVQKKETYTVREQVRCLVVQCTSSRVLAVTRSPWEPWL